MASLVILGTAAAVPDSEHENTHMALVAKQGVVLVDCVGTPTVRLAEAGISLNAISDLVVTHFHPDHVSGIPMLLMGMWLQGRTQPLTIHGLEHCLERVRGTMDFYDWQTWPGFFQVQFHDLPEEEGVQVLEREDFRVIASPVVHLIPTIGLRFESRPEGRAIVYSCDTEPCDALRNLAEGANVLLHEASGANPGHSTAAQAGELARQAGVKRLLLIHYPLGEAIGRQMLAQAEVSFGASVALAKDLMTIDL
ncbi:MAG: MBL fold metallo-hydrolase [Anaerolineales bacterium]|jgi:ribonuclease Z